LEGLSPGEKDEHVVVDEAGCARTFQEMPAMPDDSSEDLSFGAEREIDLICERFEDRLLAGERPRMEDYLDQRPEPAWMELLRQLLRQEIDYRRRGGEVPVLADYLPRWPEQADLIEKVLNVVIPAPESAPAVPPLRLLDPEPTGPYLVTPPADEAGLQTDSGERPTRVLERPLAPVALPEQFGRYRILHLLGQGGMGMVYLAQDTDLDRPVALKVALFGPGDSLAVVERFRRSARAAARLAHPNLCPIYEVGEFQGIDYLAMPHLEMPTLASRLKDGLVLEPRQAAALVYKLATALQAAHGAGIVHRDLNPANILINAEGEPIVVDFGLALRLDAGTTRLTQTGQMLGTPGYTAPEQLSGVPEAQGPSCDVFSLGVILYELLTGQMPFGRTLQEVLLRIMTQDPAPPSTLRPGINPVLDAICLKALACKVEGRYRSMGELARALQVCQDGQERLKRRARFAGWGRLVAILGGGLMVAAAGALMRGGRLPDPLPDSGGQVAEDASGKGTAQEVEEAGDLVNEVRRIRWEGRHTYFTAFSPDSRYYLATGEGSSSLPPKTVRVWEAATGRQVLEVQGNECAAFTPNGQLLLAAGPDRSLHLWETATGKEVRRFTGHTGWVASLVISPDGKLALSGAHDGTARLWDLETGEELMKAETKQVRVRVRFSPDGKRFLTFNDGPGGVFRLWDVATRREIHSWEHPRVSGHGCAFLPDGKQVVAVGGDTTVHWWDVGTGKEVRSLKLRATTIYGVAISPDRRRLLYTSHAEDAVHLVELSDGRETARFEVPFASYGRMSFSPDGRYAAGASANGWVYLWRLPEPPAANGKP
jgi:hypothetical protein